MALKWLRDNLRHLKFVLWGVVAVFVLLVFVDWGAGRSGGPTGVDEAIRIGDRVVSERQFVNEVRLKRLELQRLAGDSWEQLQSTVNVAQMTANEIVSRELLVMEARKAGLVVSDNELRQSIQRAFFGDQPFNLEQYERIIRGHYRMTPRQFENWFADQVLAGKLMSTVQSGVYVSDDEVEDAYRRQQERADLAAIQLPYEPFLSEVIVEEAEIAGYFDEHAEEYRRPEQRVVRYLVVETSRLRRLLPAEEGDLETYYEEHLEDFVVGEQANARHILISSTAGGSATQRADAELRADSVMRIAQSGADFAELAALHSDDPGSKENGGDLGWFGRGEMVAEFEDAVFGAKPGEIIGPVESQFGFHVIKVEGFKPQHQQPFEEVVEDVRYRFLEGRAVAEAEVRAAALARRVVSEKPETEETWQLLADEDEAVVLNVSPPFARGATVPGTGGGTELAEEVFAAKPDAVGGPRAIPRGWMVWQVSEIQPAGVPPFEDVRDRVEQEVRRLKAMGRAMAAGLELADRWRSGGDGRELAAEFGSRVTEARDHRWGAVIGTLGSSSPVDELVFSASEGEVLGPVRIGNRGMAVVRVDRLQLVDRDALEGSREDFRSRLMAERGQNLMQSIINERRRDTQIDINAQLLERFAPRG